MIRSGNFTNKKILLVDRESKKKNDRTWCFWENEKGIFEDIVYKKWEKAWFKSKDTERLMQLDPYEYKLVRGIDFYSYCFDLIGAQPGIDVRLDNEIETIGNDDAGAYIIIDGQRIDAGYIFNSTFAGKPALKRNEHYLLQHFKGWVIETAKPVFDPEEAILMDFRVDQQQGTTFAYVMPFSPTRALVEYTLFTEKLLSPDMYDEGLRNYINRFFGISEFVITEQEFGVIPMTNHSFPDRDGNIIHIGTAGGQTKASSGYTFRFIQKHSAEIVRELISSGRPFLRNEGTKKRFDFYDGVLLNILANDKVPGHEIFSALFKKNKPQQVLRFLDNESSLKEELQIISSLPVWPFLKAAVQQLL